MAPRAFKPPRPSASTGRSNTRQTGSIPRDPFEDESSKGESDSPSAQQSAPTARRQSANTERDAQAAAEQQSPLIPALLLTRICQENFHHPDTKLGKEARMLLGKYMDTFVREALARAKHEMDQKKGAARTRDFLEVEDLEKLAPQLLLDF
jgi:centromere protein X